jgi:hypothetical protein
MRKRAILCFMILCLSLFFPTGSVLSASGEDEWQSIEPGIDYREYLLPGPNRVFVARMDRSQENVILDTSIAQGRLAYGAEKVSNMTTRYEDALNFWEYPAGYRNHVSVAINGSFVNPGTSVPYSGVIQSGWYAKRYDNFSGVSFGWKFHEDILSRKAYISDCVSHDANKQYILFTTNYQIIPIDGINIYRPSDSLVLYTHHFDRSTWTANDGIEVLVELNRPSMILSEPRGAKGIVRAIRNPGGSSLIPFDHVVLSAHGTAADKLRTILAEYGVGEEIEIEVSQEIKNFVDDCRQNVAEPDWTKTYAGITGDHTYLVDGNVIAHPNPAKNSDVHPRTAIAFNDQYIYFIVVDGRQPRVSVGMTYVQLGAFSVGYLGATAGLALDGGGSSTMLINGKVVNNPSDRCFPLYLPYMTAPNTVVSGVSPLMEVSVIESLDATGSLPANVCERGVGSGVMMIVLQPKLSSDVFQPGYTILSQGEAQIRLGPGTNYALMATITEGQEGTILPHSSGLDGVFAKGKYWWKVNFGSVTGWVSQDSLIRKPNSGTPN